MDRESPGPVSSGERERIGVWIIRFVVDWMMEKPATSKRRPCCRSNWGARTSLFLRSNIFFRCATSDFLSSCRETVLKFASWSRSPPNWPSCNDTIWMKIADRDIKLDEHSDNYWPPSNGTTWIINWSHELLERNLEIKYCTVNWILKLISTSFDSHMSNFFWFQIGFQTSSPSPTM